MITLQCPHCGESLPAASAATDGGLRCPGCGQPLPGNGSPSTTWPFAIPLHDPSDQTPQPGEPSPDAETLISATQIPPQLIVPPSYAFLDPAQAEGELGRLASYRVLRLVGRGGMGQVFEAEDTELLRRVAIKVMHPEAASDPAARQRFLREARATAAVRSDHVVTIHQVGQHRDLPYLVMEYLEGMPLDQWLVAHVCPPMTEVLRIGCQIGRGLAAAHDRGLIHRDVKPSNIWMEDGTGRIKILDFGLVRTARGDSQLTHTGQIMGTPAYMAPEQAEGLPADVRSDLFSFGCVLYQLAAGEPPFRGANPLTVLKAVMLQDPPPLPQVNPQVPRALGHLIHQLLAKNPEERPTSAATVADALQAIAANPEASPSSVMPSLGLRRGKRRPTWIAAGVVAGFMLLAAGIVWMVPAFRAPRAGGSTPSAALSPEHGAAPAASTSPIVFGMSAPFSGPSRELGHQMKLGIDACFDALNDEGGIGGRPVKLVALDDGYEPARALDNMKNLVEERHVFGVLGNVGTATAAVTVPYALAQRLPFFGAFSGATLLRHDPPDRYVFNYRASYAEETAAITHYLVRSRKIRPEEIAVFAQRDAYGDDGFNGVARAMRQYERDPDIILRVGYTRNLLDVDAGARQILQHRTIRAVVMIATYSPAAAFIKQLRDGGYTGLFTNVSFTGSEALAEALREDGPAYLHDVIVTQVVPPIHSASTVVLKYRQQLSRYYPNEHPSFVSLEGFLAAEVLVEGLRRASKNLTADTLVDTLEGIHDLDLGTGAPFSFGPSEHQASHKIWGTTLDSNGEYQPLDLD